MTFREGERGSRKTNIEGGGLPKKGVLEQFADLRRGLGKKKGGGVFERGGVINAHYGVEAVIRRYSVK